MSNKKRNSRGQIGETLTWIVATILIIVILTFFIFGASMLGGTKKVSDYFASTLTAPSTFEGGDTFLKKSLYTYNLLEEKRDITLVDWKLKKLEEEKMFILDLNETKIEIKLRLNKK